VAAVQRYSFEKSGGARTARAESVATAMGTRLALFVGEASCVFRAIVIADFAAS
jgi:hypothetical protein